MANTQVTTTGLLPLTIGSTETFEATADLNSLPWNLAGGSAVLKLADPTGAITTLPATIGPTGYEAHVNWTVVGPTGTWNRAWVLTDVTGRVQVSRPIFMTVISSPI